MRSEKEIEKEIKTLEDFVLKYARYFNQHGSGVIGGKIASLQWVIEDG